jgi:hypothetical protein
VEDGSEKKEYVMVRSHYRMIGGKKVKVRAYIRRMKAR